MRLVADLPDHDHNCQFHDRWNHDLVELCGFA
jgi:hypothetical protein